MNRRDAIKYGLMGTVGVAFPAWRFQVGRDKNRSPRAPLFEIPLPRPPVLTPTRSDATGDYYEIEQREATATIIPGYQTTIWGYNGIFPGPIIEARRERPVTIRQSNLLPVPTVTHLHGAVTAPESDGYPTDFVLPTDPAAPGHAAHGASGNTSVGFKDYHYPNNQRGATLWYHDHRMDFTGPQVYRGLAGMYILRDDVEDQLPLPRGEREIPLIITDRTFNEDGSLHYPSKDPTLLKQAGVNGQAHDNGMTGDTILVNGAPWPVLEVERARYRFRVLNASNARRYRLGLSPEPDEGSAFTQIGSDGGLLAAPRPCSSVRIAPAERFDLIIDFSKYKPGTEVILRNLAVQDPFGKGRLSMVMKFIVTRDASDDTSIPDQLSSDHPPVDESTAVKRRKISFDRKGGGDWTIDGHRFDVDRIWADPQLDSTEIWEFGGTSGHPVHLHLVHFKVLSRGDKKPRGEDIGWKDTVFLSDDPVHVLVNFSGYRGKYVFHCHNLEHEDMMMMANFEVV